MVIQEDVKAVITLDDGTEFDITSAEITGTPSISSQCVSGSGFELGAVCSAQLSMSAKISGINRYKIIGATVKVQIFKNNEWHNAGIFNVTSASRYRDIITISASDNMIYLDKSAYTVNDNSKKLSSIAEYLKTQRTIYEALKYIVEISGLELRNSQEEIEKMPNGTLPTVVFQEVNTDCPRDWLAWCAEFLSGFAYADENGKIRIKQFEKEPSATISQSEIQSDTSDIADFKILLAHVEITTFDEGYGSYYNAKNDGKPNTIGIDLTDNIIAQGKNYIYLNSMDVLRNIYNDISKVAYRPFTATVHSNSIFSLGQCISIEDYDGQFYDTVITNITYTLNGGYQLKCAGSDTRLLADTKNRTALKRESEKLQSKINEAKGKDVTQSELDQLALDGKLVEGMTYYVYEE